MAHRAPAEPPPPPPSGAALASLVERLSPDARAVFCDLFVALLDFCLRDLAADPDSARAHVAATAAALGAPGRPPVLNGNREGSDR